MDVYAFSGALAVAMARTTEPANMVRFLAEYRPALHLPEQLPPPLPTLSGPGRTDAFAVLSVGLLATPAGFDAPVKYGFIWNLDRRTWVHTARRIGGRIRRISLRGSR